VDQAAKAGLVLGETTENYLAANPALGGDPATLNLPSMAQARCINSCTFERTFRATRANQRNWDAHIEGLAGYVDQPKFNLGANGSGTLRVTIDSSALPANSSWNFGALVLTPRGDGDSPVLRLPIVVAVPAPQIALQDEASLSLAAGASGELSVSIGNIGGPVLEYSLQGAGTAPRVVIDQPRGGVTSGNRSGFVTGTGLGYYLADDFSVAETTPLSLIQAEGFTQGVAIGSGASALTWSIFPDAGGVPAGNPRTSPGAAIWSYTAAPNSPGVTTNAASTITLNLAAAGQAVSLPPGTYWLVVHSTTATLANNWIRFFSNTSSGNPAVFSTGGAWSLQSFPAANGRIEQAAPCAAPAWLTSVTPTGGTLGGAGTGSLSVKVSAAGLAPGTYTAYVCVASNDTARPVATTRIAVTVQ
jgi:hypothetical protein